jgi:GntR family transcriptional regulator/MocR family aminotransferase
VGQTSSGTSDQTSSRELLVDLGGVARGGWGAELERSVRAAIRSGRLRPGARLPSTRALAADLGVSRSVVVQAFEQLAAEGYLTARPGAVARVSDACALPGFPASEPVRSDGAQPPQPGRSLLSLRPGSPSLGNVPRVEWGRAVRSALSALTDAELGYGDSQGLSRLREALADYLGRVRGAMVEPQHLVVVNGFAQGLVVAAGVLRERGCFLAGVEDPGSADTLAHLAAQGLDLVALPVDHEGVDIDAAPLGSGGDMRAVLVTPAHQFPTGAVLGPARRRRLVEWAERVDGLVIEDDYDAEYRYDHHPISVVQGMAPDRVILGGSVSKTLAPGLRLGWLVMPPSLVEAATRHKRAIDLMAPVLEQAALAELITSGSYERHIRRTRNHYRRRRDLLVELLARELPDAEVLGASAGLHLAVMTPWVPDESTVVAEAAHRGLQVVGLGQHRRRPGPSGFVLGYGHLTDDHLRRAVRILADVSRA